MIAFECVIQEYTKNVNFSRENLNSEIEVWTCLDLKFSIETENQANYDDVTT